MRLPGQAAHVGLDPLDAGLRAAGVRQELARNVDARHLRASGGQRDGVTSGGMAPSHSSTKRPSKNDSNQLDCKAVLHFRTPQNTRVSAKLKD
jgi:hypothetical protein